jgi:RHS repeat-associated protein
VNGRGQATQETFGNGVVLKATYQFQTGQVTGITYSSGATNLRQLGYGYDVFGNLKRQSLNASASREDYTYDQLQRLVSAIRSGAASGTVNYGYDAVGNLTKKSDFSANAANAYVYTGGSCGGGANAVKSVSLATGGSRTYCYDPNGNLTSDSAGLAIAYDHQNLPTKATRGAQTDWFRYGADGQRTRSWGSDGARVYLPGYEHRTDTGETKVYVGDYAVISKTGSTRKVEYLLKDRLGSVDAVASSAGAITETRGYDAFGKPRDGSWNDLSPAKIASTAVTPKGFTQHEHLNQLELIHMNGRVYDYGLGRFTGVDPFIQFPLNSQSLNPYSYILNNPLSGTDPTGYSFLRDVLTGQAQLGWFDAPPERKSKNEFFPITGGNGSEERQPGSNSVCTGGAICSFALADGAGGILSAMTRENIPNGGREKDTYWSGLGKSGLDTLAGIGNTVLSIGAPLLNGMDYLMSPKDSAFDNFHDAVTYKGNGFPSYGGTDTKAGDAGYRTGQAVILLLPELVESRAAGAASRRSAGPESLNLRQSEQANSAAAPVEVAPSAPVPIYNHEQIYGPFYRLGDSAENITSIQESGILYGNAGRNTHYGDIPAVRAYKGKLPEGRNGFEFYTPVAPSSGSHPKIPHWNLPSPGVVPRGEGQVQIPCVVTCVQTGA